jgi:hypothetical protein
MHLSVEDMILKQVYPTYFTAHLSNKCMLHAKNEAKDGNENEIEQDKIDP